MSVDKEKFAALMTAVGQTLLNLKTTMPAHPAECLCYACNLRKAYFDIQITAFSCGKPEGSS